MFPYSCNSFINIFHSKQISNFVSGSKQGLYLFATLKVPLLIISTLIQSIVNSNIIFSATRVSVGNMSCLNNVIFIPVVEEIFFRGIIQKGIKKITIVAITTLKIYNGNDSLGTEKKVENIAYQTSRIATSLLFGLAHYPGGGVVQVLSAGFGAYYGEAELVDKLGLTSALGCHMTNNLMSHLLKNIIDYI